MCSHSRDSVPPNTPDRARYNKKYACSWAKIIVTKSFELCFFSFFKKWDIFLKFENFVKVILFLYKKPIDKKFTYLFIFTNFHNFANLYMLNWKYIAEIKVKDWLDPTPDDMILNILKIFSCDHLLKRLFLESKYYI